MLAFGIVADLTGAAVDLAAAGGLLAGADLACIVRSFRITGRAKRQNRHEETAVCVSGPGEAAEPPGLNHSCPDTALEKPGCAVDLALEGSGGPQQDSTEGMAEGERETGSGEWQ